MERVKRVKLSSASILDTGYASTVDSAPCVLHCQTPAPCEMLPPTPQPSRQLRAFVSPDSDRVLGMKRKAPCLMDCDFSVLPRTTLGDASSTGCMSDDESLGVPSRCSSPPPSAILSVPGAPPPAPRKAPRFRNFQVRNAGVCRRLDFDQLECTLQDENAPFLM